jgi:hypothetical protein
MAINFPEGAQNYPGSIVQVVNMLEGTPISTTSTSWQTIMSATITPKASGNRILIIITGTVGASSTAATAQSVYRGSTKILSGDAVSGTTASSGPTGYGGSSDGNNNEAVAISGVDSPNTTSSVTYYYKFRSPQGTTVRVNDLGSASRNASYSQTSQSSIVLMEFEP